MSRVEDALGAIVTGNNERARRLATDRDDPNPRPTADLAWNRALEAAWPDIRAEWDEFVGGGGRLPLIEELIDEHQGNEGPWRAGLLVSKGRPATRLARRFPRTVDHLEAVPGLWSGLWSLMEPGTELGIHTGPNAGMLRYHLGIDCGEDAALEVEGTVVPYRDGRGILFDDTVEHRAWNRGPNARVTLFLEVLRPIPGTAGVLNHGVQRLIALDPRYRRAPGRADLADRALNGA